MGFGAMAVRTIGVGILGLSLWAGGSYVVDRINSSNAVVESGYVSPKSVAIEGKRNAAGNVETYLNYKSGDETVSLPVRKGPHGPLVGTVDYWWQSIASGERSGLVESEWPALDSDVKHGIMSSELQTIIDSFYGVNNPQNKQQAPYLQQRK